MTDPPDQERRILDYGDEAVDRALDAILDNRATAEPLKEESEEERILAKCKKKAPGKTLVIIAGGWHYASSSDEITAIGKGSWNPTTEDFVAVAQANKSTPFSAKTPEEFIQHIAGSSGKLGRVVFIGHGGINGILFSGDIEFMQGSSRLSEDNIAEFESVIKNNLRAKLHADAKIDLITCTNGADKTFMDAMANAFGRCIRAFSSQIEFRNPVVDGTKITKRGLTRVSGTKTYKKGWKHLRLQECVCP